MKIEHFGKIYEVDSIFANIINVNGTSITKEDGYYTVFVEGDEVFFKDFDKAYNFAIYEQKDTIYMNN